jgi:hypothetical protein
MLTRKDRARWLQGRKIHGVTLDGRGIACRPSYSLASGWAFYDRCSREHYDLRQVTCRRCRKAIRGLILNDKD